MPEFFKDLGYTTFGTGKWHNGVPSYSRSFSDGAEIFFGGMDDHWNVPACDFNPDGSYPKPIERNVPWIPGKTIKNERQFDHIHVGKHSTDIFADATMDFLKNHDDDRPFFAYVSFMAPHDPRTMPREFRNMYDATEINLPNNFLPEHPFDNGWLKNRDEQLETWPRTKEKIREHIADYYAMITHLDAAIGKILHTLEASGQLDNTLIVLAGDNGLAIGQHGLMGKQNNYDHSLHVPLIISGPGLPKRETNISLCYLFDIFPTICELLGLEPPPSVLGRSLAPTIGQNGNYQQPREFLHFAFKDLIRSVQDLRFKLIEYVVDGKRETQLFDLLEDPFETENLIENYEYQEVYRRLQKELLKLQKEINDTREDGKRFWSGYELSQ